MEIDIGRGKKGRRAYGFDDIAIVPSRRTRDPDDIDISWTLGPYRFEIPLVASAMDGVVSPETAALVNRLGGTHHGYFLPHESSDYVAIAMFSFPSLSAYEAYRAKAASDPECQKAAAYYRETRCFLKYDRSFLRPVFQ